MDHAAPVRHAPVSHGLLGCDLLRRDLLGCDLVSRQLLSGSGDL